MWNEDKYGYAPKTEEDLINYLHEIESQYHSYDSIAEGLSKVTVAMFNYFAHKHGMTGFQASWAGLKFIMLSRGLDMPIMLVDSSKLMYPQYDLHKELDEFIENIKPELSKKAKEELNNIKEYTSKVVISHWEQLANCSK